MDIKKNPHTCIDKSEKRESLRVIFQFVAGSNPTPSVRSEFLETQEAILTNYSFF